MLCYCSSPFLSLFSPLLSFSFLPFLLCPLLLFLNILPLFSRTRAWYFTYKFIIIIGSQLVLNDSNLGGWVMQQGTVLFWYRVFLKLPFLTIFIHLLWHLSSFAFNNLLFHGSDFPLPPTHLFGLIFCCLSCKHDFTLKMISFWWMLWLLRQAWSCVPNIHC